MKKLMIALLALCMPAVALVAKEVITGDNLNVKYVASAEDLKAGKWIPLQGVTAMKHDTRKKQYGKKTSADYQFESKDKAVQKILDKTAYAIMFNDSLLMVNVTKKIAAVNGNAIDMAQFGKGYMKCRYTLDGDLYFLYFDLLKRKLNGALGTVGLAGAVAAHASRGVRSQTDVVYIVRPGVKKIFTSYCAKDMKQLLEEKGHGEMMDEYMEPRKHDRGPVARTFPMLKAAGIIPADDDPDESGLSLKLGFDEEEL